MRKAILLSTLATAIGVVSAGWSTTARADEVVVKETVYMGPDRGLLWTGVVAGGIPYIASVVVAAESDHTGDTALFIPVAGPWVDLAQRGGCPVANTSCNGETFNKVMLVGDGILQGIGALAIVSAFLLPERGRGRHASLSPELHFTPLTMPGGGGFAALGTF